MRTENHSQGQGRRFKIELAHQVAEKAERDSNPDVEHADIDAVRADENEHENKRRQQRIGSTKRLHPKPDQGQVKTNSITLPIYMDATSPQKRAGFSVTSMGPGRTPWISSAAKIIAIDAFPGIPNVSSGMNEPVAALLFAASGAATPSMPPFPKRSGCLLVTISMRDRVAFKITKAFGQK